MCSLLEVGTKSVFAEMCCKCMHRSCGQCTYMNTLRVCVCNHAM